MAKSITIAGENREVDCKPGGNHYNRYMFVSTVEELEADGRFDPDGYVCSYDGYLVRKDGDEFIVSVRRMDQGGVWEDLTFDVSVLADNLRFGRGTDVIVHVGLKNGQWDAYVEMVCPEQMRAPIGR